MRSAPVYALPEDAWSAAIRARVSLGDPVAHVDAGACALVVRAHTRHETKLVQVDAKDDDATAVGEPVAMGLGTRGLARRDESRPRARCRIPR